MFLWRKRMKMKRGIVKKWDKMIWRVCKWCKTKIKEKVSRRKWVSQTQMSKEEVSQAQCKCGRISKRSKH